MSENTWPCKDIKRSADGDIWVWSEQCLKVRKDVNYCCYCGAKRPKESKALWEHLSNLMEDTISDGFYKEMSRNFLKWVNYNLPKNVKLGDYEALDIPIWIDREMDKCK